MTTKITKAMIRELCTICTHNEAGEHFTQTSTVWIFLEDDGLIDICRPVHSVTGIPYGQDAWSLEVTEAGRALVDSLA